MLRPLHKPAGRLLLTGVLLLSWSGAVPALLLAQQQAPAPRAATTGATAGAAADPKAVAQTISNFVKIGAEELRRPGADPSDVPAKARELRLDPQRIFAFVRDEIAYEPYRGVLRGARGTLAAGAGNALDKALLLQSLLAASGQKATLVRGKLPADKAQALVAAYLAADPSKGVLGDFVQPAADVPQELAQRVGMSAEDLRAIVEQSRASASGFEEEASRATGEESAHLLEQLGKANVKLGRPFEKWAAELASRAADHAWVEWADAQGRATALDPCFRDAQPGTAAAQGQPVKDPAKDLAADRHVVTFQVVYATDEGGGAPKEQAILEVPLASEQAFLDAPSFTVEPAEPLKPAAELLAMTREQAIKYWTGFKQYQAVVTVGRQRFASKAFDLKGNVMEVAADGRVKGAQQLGSSAGGLFGGLGGGLGGGAKKEAPDRFAGLSVLLTFQSPGEKPAPQRRTLVARADVTGAHFLSPILHWQMLVQPEPLSAKLAGYQSLKHTVDTLSPVTDALKEGTPVETLLERMARQQPSNFPAVPAEFAMFRQAALAKALQAEPKVAALWDRPQVVVAERRFCAMLDGSKVCSRFTVDIFSNELSFVPRDASAAGAAASAALRQGVYDTVAEAIIVRRQTQGAAQDRNATQESAAADAGQARVAGGGLAVAAGGDPAAAANLPLAEDDRAWVARYEPPARRVLVPSAAAGASAAASQMWWSLDPETGSILGRRAGGRGQATSEYVVQLATGVICMIFTVWNYKLDESSRGGSSNENQKQGGAVALLGCAIGASFGIAAVGTVGLTNGVLTLINAVIGGLFSMWGGSIGRRPA